MSDLTEHERIFLSELNEHPVWKSIVEKTVAFIPELPSFAVDSVTGKDNRQEWMSESLYRDGFKACLNLLGVKND